MKNKIIKILLTLYYIFAFLSSFLVVHYYLDMKFNLPISVIYIILCGILYYQKNQIDEQAVSKQNQDIHNTAILIDNINKFNYNKLKIVKKIEFNLFQIKITLKDDISYMLDYNYFYFLKSEQELIEFDKYIYDNYNKEVNENLVKNDKNHEEFYKKYKKENTLYYLCIKYNLKR